MAEKIKGEGYGSIDVTPFSIAGIDLSAGMIQGPYGKGKYYFSVSSDVFKKGFFASGKISLWDYIKSISSPDYAFSLDAGYGEVIRSFNFLNKEAAVSGGIFAFGDLSTNLDSTLSWDAGMSLTSMVKRGGLEFYASYSFLPVAGKLFEQFRTPYFGVYKPEALFQISYSSDNFKSSISFKCTRLYKEFSAEATLGDVTLYIKNQREYGGEVDLLSLYRRFSGKKVSVSKKKGKLSFDYIAEERIEPAAAAPTTVLVLNNPGQNFGFPQEFIQDYTDSFGDILSFDEFYNAAMEFSDRFSGRIYSSTFMDFLSEKFPGKKETFDSLSTSNQIGLTDFLNGIRDEQNHLYFTFFGKGVVLDDVFNHLFFSKHLTTQSLAGVISSLPKEDQIGTLAVLGGMMMRHIYDKNEDYKRTAEFSPNDTLSLLAKSLREDKDYPGPVCAGIHQTMCDIAHHLGLEGYPLIFNWGRLHAGALIRDPETGKNYFLNYSAVIEFDNFNELPQILERVGGEKGSKNPIITVCDYKGFPIATIRLEDISKRIFIPHHKQMKKALRGS